MPRKSAPCNFRKWRVILIAIILWFVCGMLFHSKTKYEPDSWFARPFCLPNEAEALATKFLAAIRAHHHFSSCPTHAWLPHLPTLFDNDTVFYFDIGCNKGYECAQVIAAFYPHCNFNSKIVHNTLNTYAKDKNFDIGGVCDDYKHTVHTIPHMWRGNLVIHCFEPSMFNFR